MHKYVENGWWSFGQNPLNFIQVKEWLAFKKVWFSDQDILVICRQVNHEKHTQRVLPKRMGRQNIENQMISEAKNT